MGVRSSGVGLLSQTRPIPRSPDGDNNSPYDVRHELHPALSRSRNMFRDVPLVLAPVHSGAIKEIESKDRW